MILLIWEEKDTGSAPKNTSTILSSFYLQTQPLFFLTLPSSSASQNSEILNPRKTIPYAIPPFKQRKTAQIEYITLPLHISFSIQCVPSLLPICTHNVLKPDKSFALISFSTTLCCCFVLPLTEHQSFHLFPENKWISWTRYSFFTSSFWTYSFWSHQGTTINNIHPSRWWLKMLITATASDTCLLPLGPMGWEYKKHLGEKSCSPQPYLLFLDYQSLSMTPTLSLPKQP